jgi:hypothetical protein
MPPEEPPDGADGAGTTAGVGAGAGVGVGAGVVVGVVVVGVVDPDPESVAPPAEGTVTGLVGAGVGTGRGSGAGLLLDEPRGGMVTGDERTGIEGSDNDPLPESETRSALMTLAAEVADGTTTTSDVRAALEDAPGTYEVGWAVDAVVPVTAGAGVGVDGDATGAGSVGAATSPDQSEAEYVRFGVTFL